MRFFVIFGVFLVYLCQETFGLYCVDENNEQVDWYFAYKFPNLGKKIPNQNVRFGIGYAYITSKNSSAWTLSTFGVNDTNSLIGRTLSPLYDSNSVTSWHILYNDQSPSGSENTKRGHTKGVVLGEDSGGLWLVHSVPKFPVDPTNAKGYAYPSTGVTFGQSFLCISLDIVQLNVVGKLLQNNEIHVYSQNVPYLYKSSYPELYNAANGVTSPEPLSQVQEIQSLNGVSFVGFAKNRWFGKDLYNDLVAPYFDDVLFAETWPNGPGRMNSSCSKEYSVQNVAQISFDFLAEKAIFKSTHDHSKWALCSNKKIVCVGDINRETTQEKRGGGTVCLKNDEVADNYKKSIMQLEDCPKL